MVTPRPLYPGGKSPGPENKIECFGGQKLLLSWLGIKASVTHNFIISANVLTGSTALKVMKSAPLPKIILSTTIPVSFLPQSIKTTTKLQNSNITSCRMSKKKKKVNLFGSEIKYRKEKRFKTSNIHLRDTNSCPKHKRQHFYHCISLLKFSRCGMYDKTVPLIFSTYRFRTVCPYLN